MADVWKTLRPLISTSSSIKKKSGWCGIYSGKQYFVKLAKTTLLSPRKKRISVTVEGDPTKRLEYADNVGNLTQTDPNFCSGIVVIICN